MTPLSMAWMILDAVGEWSISTIDAIGKVQGFYFEELHCFLKVDIK